MRAKITRSIGEAVAANVKHWRKARGLDQQQLADRLDELGWSVDRTAIARIERGPGRDGRKVTVDELGMLAAALNVPLTVLLLPLVDGADVKVAPKVVAVNRWTLFETMLGNVAYPHGAGAARDVNIIEFELGAMPLRAYNIVRNARRAADQAASDEWLLRLQTLVNEADSMERIGYPAQDLIALDDQRFGAERMKAIKEHRIRPSHDRQFNVGEAAEGGAQ
jgi:transcriptional regulator with XRE-family HTH domain